MTGYEQSAGGEPQLPSPGKADLHEYIAAAVVIAFGVFFAAIAFSYPLGSMLRPGSGFVPLAVGVLIAALGVGILYEVRAKPAERREYRLRPLAVVSIGIVLFGLLVERAGFVPATIALVFLAGLGERNPRWLPLLGVAAFVCVFGIVLFIWALGVPLEAIGGLR